MTHRRCLPIDCREVVGLSRVDEDRTVDLDLWTGRRDLWTGPLDGTGTTERDARASGARPAPKVGEARQEDEEDEEDDDDDDGVPTRLDSTRFPRFCLSISREREREGWLAP